jgi:murein L,D-transpeptidase YcbB/YkuD
MGLKDIYNFQLDDELVFNENLEEHVKSFQEKNNLNVDGVFGNKGWAILKSNLKVKKKKIISVIFLFLQ